MHDKLHHISPLISLMAPKPIPCSEENPCNEKIKTALCDTASNLGFEFVRFTRWVSGGSNLSESYSSHLCNFPVEWVSYYDTNKLYQYDPVVRYTQESTANRLNHGTWQKVQAQAIASPIGSTQQEQSAYIESVQELFITASRYRLNSGAFIASEGLGTSRLFMSVASGNSNPFYADAITPPLWPLLNTTLVLTDKLMSSLSQCKRCGPSLYSHGNAPISLTDRQQQVLTLFLNNRDASIEDISKLYGTSRDNVNFHLKSIREKFGQPGLSGHMLAQFAREHHFI